jgi:hypothetical protein
MKMKNMKMLLLSVCLMLMASSGVANAGGAQGTVLYSPNQNGGRTYPLIGVNVTLQVWDYTAGDVALDCYATKTSDDNSQYAAYSYDFGLGIPCNSIPLNHYVYIKVYSVADQEGDKFPIIADGDSQTPSSWILNQQQPAPNQAYAYFTIPYTGVQMSGTVVYKP